MSPIFCPLLADLPLGLVLIRQKALVGHLPGNHKVYKITKIAVIPLSDEEPQELELEVRKQKLNLNEAQEARFTHLCFN